MRETSHWLDQPRNVQRLLYGFYSLCALLLVLDLILHRHTEHPWERLTGFYPLYGFVGCVILVFVAKWMRGFLMRPEDYYDSHEAEAREPAERGERVGEVHSDA